MAEYHIAGAAVAVVKDGQVLLAKGYGYADIERASRSTPNRRSFRWLSRQAVHLDRGDATRRTGQAGSGHGCQHLSRFPHPGYLSGTDHPEAPDRRILPASKTAGSSGAVPTSTSWCPPRDWMVSHMAERCGRRARCRAYANINAMLAGYIVARVSGEPYDQYIQEHIFAPWACCTELPSRPPPDLRAHLVRGIHVRDGALPAFPRLHRCSPAVTPLRRTPGQRHGYGAIHDRAPAGRPLQRCDIPEARILKKPRPGKCNTRRTLRPALLGTAYGFFDLSDNGQRNARA